jgi:protein-disulfide isomerase
VKAKIDSALTGILVACALITTGLVVHREFIAPSTSAQRSSTERPVFVANWKSYIGDGVQIGQPTGPVQLIEFADFECPYCGQFHQVLKTLLQHYPDKVSLTFMHFPLKGHRFAIPAARVAECADEQGRFEAMQDQLFEGQESFGLKPWTQYATSAGVPDLAAFDACVQKTEPIPRVVQDEHLGNTLDVQATPTLIINGWKLARPPTDEELDAMVKAVLAGKEPVSGARKS